MRYVLALLCAASAVQAQDWTLRQGDQPLNEAALQSRLSGEIIEFYDGGQAEFYADGRYTYTYADEGGTGYGYWKIDGPGKICIEFVNGFSRCDMYVRAGERLVLLTEKGDRFPIR